MKDYLNYYVNKFSNSSKSLKKKNLLINKPWVLVDEDGDIQKYIFKDDKTLILSKKGEVIKGTWDYFPEANSLLIETKHQNLLLNEKYIDENVLILKTDGVDDNLFSMANQNLLPNYDIQKYFIKLDIKELGLSEDYFELQGESRLYTTYGTKHHSPDKGDVIVLSKKNEYLPVKHTTYYAKDFSHFWIIKNGNIKGFGSLYKLTSINDYDYYIVDVPPYAYNIYKISIGKKILFDGNEVKESIIRSKDNTLFYVKDGIIKDVKFIKEYHFKGGLNVFLLQNNEEISKGDKLFSEATSEIPDGTYKLEGKMFSKIKFINGVVVSSTMLF
jgi:hypothetical protein